MMKFDTLFHPTVTGGASSPSQAAKVAPRPFPIKPGGTPFRRWHLTPWKRTEATALLDDINGTMLGDDSEDESETSSLDVLNNLISQAGNIAGARSGMVVARPKPGQLVPAGSGMFGLSNQTLLLAGAAVLGVILLSRK